MAYKRVTEEERWLIYRWQQEGTGVREVARRLGRAASSICRELLRNTGGRGYRPQQAHAQAQAQARRMGPRRFTETVRVDAEARLKAGWTPEMIGQRARLEGRPWVCKETIYQHFDADAKTGGTLWQHHSPAPSASGGDAVPVRRDADAAGFRTSAGLTPGRPRWRHVRASDTGKAT